MKAIILAFEAPAGFAKRTDKAQYKAYMDGWRAFADALQTVGVFRGGAALVKAGRANDALAALDAIDADRIGAYQPYWATRAHALAEIGAGEEARAAFDRAIGLSSDGATRQFLARRRDTPARPN